MIYIAQAHVAVNAQEILLTWTKSAEPDVIGYQVKVGKVSGGPYTAAHSGYLSKPEFSMRDMLPDKYYFTITAFDANGNFSPVSDEVSIDLRPAIPQ